jgi:hypothetical protein
MPILKGYQDSLFTLKKKKKKKQRREITWCFGVSTLQMYISGLYLSLSHHPPPPLSLSHVGLLGWVNQITEL